MFSIFSIYLQYLNFLNHQIVNFVVNFFTYDLHITTTKHRKTHYTFPLTTLYYQSNIVKHACNSFTTVKEFTNYGLRITVNYDNQTDPK